jgi:NTP pyrophosphatase (non-canonical NTP hydrolase)
MDFNVHVQELKKSAVVLTEEYTPIKADLDHMVIGLLGEVGELADCVKKHTKYNKEMDFDNFVEELGDIEFYLEGIRQTVAVTRDETLKQNMMKLAYRHPDGYTDDTAMNKADKVGDVP